MSYGYKASFIETLRKVFSKHPEMSIGEVMTSFLHTQSLGGKHFFYASDEEIYSSLEDFEGIDMQDELMNDEEFTKWMNNEHKMS